VPPCHTCPKIPRDAPARTWWYAVDLSPENVQVYTHYLECRAVGHFPNDPIVKLHARIIRQEEDHAADLKADIRAVRLMNLSILGAASNGTASTDRSRR
jgi:hypothetical protein